MNLDYKIENAPQNAGTSGALRPLAGLMLLNVEADPYARALPCADALCRRPCHHAPSPKVIPHAISESSQSAAACRVSCEKPCDATLPGMPTVCARFVGPK